MKSYFDVRIPDAPWVGDPDGYDERSSYDEDYADYCADECDRRWKEEREQGGNS